MPFCGIVVATVVATRKDFVNSLPSFYLCRCRLSFEIRCFFRLHDDDVNARPFRQINGSTGRKTPFSKMAAIIV